MGVCRSSRTRVSSYTSPLRCTENLPGRERSTIVDPCLPDEILPPSKMKAQSSHSSMNSFKSSVLAEPLWFAEVNAIACPYCLATACLKKVKNPLCESTWVQRYPDEVRVRNSDTQKFWVWVQTWREICRVFSTQQNGHGPRKQLLIARRAFKFGVRFENTWEDIHRVALWPDALCLHSVQHPGIQKRWTYRCL